MGAIKDLITTFVGDRLIELMNSGTNRIADEISQIANNRILEYLCVEYERNSMTKTFLHRSEPIILESIYQPLHLQPAVERWGQICVNNSKRIPTDNIKDIFVKGKCATIIGTAGSGKSTLVKYLFVNAIKSKFKIPIKIELRYLNDYTGSLLSYIEEEIIKFSGIAEREKIIEKMFLSGDFIMFFDGYDEVSSQKKETLTKDICRITKKYPNNYYILTSRPFVNIDMIENFVNYHVCDLSEDEMVAFVNKQFPDSERELADKIIQIIKDKNSKTYRSFLSNPLLLSMFIITYQTDSDIPQKRSDYYNQVFNTLYSVHDTSSKLGFVREKKSGLSKEDFVKILKRFSFKSFFNRKYSFALDYFESQITQIKNDLHLIFSNDDLISDLEVAIGILTQEGLEITFPHRSLQEYFAALYVKDISASNKDKMYDEFLLPQFKSLYQGKLSQNDNSNFFSLLNEMDSDMVKRKLIIPSLTALEKNRSELKTSTDIIAFFISLHVISQFLDYRTSGLFNQEYEKYNRQFSKYMKEGEKSVNSDKSKRVLPASKRTMALEKLANNDVSPFINTYSIKSEIENIESTLKVMDDIDSAVIDSMLKKYPSS